MTTSVLGFNSILIDEADASAKCIKIQEWTNKAETKELYSVIQILNHTISSRAENTEALQYSWIK